MIIDDDKWEYVDSSEDDEEWEYTDVDDDEDLDNLVLGKVPSVYCQDKMHSAVFEDNAEAVVRLKELIEEMFSESSSLLVEINKKLLGETGLVEEVTEDGWRKYYEENGVLHGVYQEVNKRTNVATWRVVGGKMWRADGKTLMVGEVDSEGRWEGTDIVYLYPGLSLAVIGQYEKGKLLIGREGILKGLEKDSSGMIVPSIRLITGRTISYESPGAHHIASNLHQRELMECMNVYVDTSKITNAGEGLFAKTEIKKGSLVSIFNGVRQRIHSRNLSVFDDTWSDYRVCLDSSINIDIPDCYISCRSYSSTLGHKACHSFSPNSRFSQVFHPRWGKVVCIMALRDIARHEEITVSYGYKMTIAPKWYSDLWQRYLRTEYGWSREDVAQYGLPAANCQNTFIIRNKIIQDRDKKQGL